MSSSTTSRRQSTIDPRSSSPSSQAAANSAARANGATRAPPMKSPSGVARPGRASVRRPGQSASSLGTTTSLGDEEKSSEDDARIENAALIDNLKKSLRNAEMVSENYESQISALAKRMDQMLKEHAQMEEQLHQSAGRIDELELKKKEASRQVREMGNIYESERLAMLRDREEQTGREAELKATIQRLKETMAGREMRIRDVVERRRSVSREGRSNSRATSVDEGGQFAPPPSMQRRPSSHQRNDSQMASRLVMQRDMMIESLRLELAEAQIKLVEMENMGGDKMQDLERTLLETRMANARLMEDNESFQLLLGEKTMNGDFAKTDLMQSSTSRHGSSALGSLAEELESAEGESENYRRLEAEARSLRDQNKALTLYIEKIISRVLQHENFETILDQKIDGPGLSGQKNLPPLPSSKDESAQPSVLQRAMSVVGPRRQRPASQLIAPAPPLEEEITKRPRPQSQLFTTAPSFGLSANEDPFTAPSIPLGRSHSTAGGRKIGHRRSQSEKSDIVAPNGTSGPASKPSFIPSTNAASVVNQMYRGPSAGSGGQISPISPGSTTPRTAYFAPSAIVGSHAAARPSSGPRNNANRRASAAAGHTDGLHSSSNSTISRESGEVPSPPRNSAGNTTYTGAVMTQNKLRPLRLVQENQEQDSMSSRRTNVVAEDEAARKRANRGSWMGWFNRGKEADGVRSLSASQIQE